MEGVDEHPEPTDATVKQLYAHAFRCAHPDCRKPLYRQNDETGEQTLNSRVAHIHARRRGGPRWIEMTSEDNRGVANLLVLCIEHSYEVDEHADRFPAQMLRDWKAKQLAEHQELLVGWPLTDAKVEAVRQESFRASAQAQVDAATLAELARQVEATRTVARRAREGPRDEARRARQTWQQARQGLTAWDAVTGEPIYATPSQFDQDNHRRALLAAIRQAWEETRLAADTVRGEVAALRAGQPDVGPWADWVLQALNGLEVASSSWPGDLPAADDKRVERAGDELVQAAGALDRRVRGQEAEDPPAPPPAPIPPHPDPKDQEHQDLLEAARPFSRVAIRPYDPELRQRLVEATTYAATLPPTLTNLAGGLEGTTYLAGAVAGNATETELRALIQSDRARRPLCTAVLLVRELAATASERGHDDVAAEARTSLRELLEEVDWTDEQAWLGSETYGANMFGWLAAAGTPAGVREKLVAALRSRSTLAPTMLLSCASWSERRDSARTHEPSTAFRTYREVPAWLPALELLETLGTFQQGHAAPDDTSVELARLAAELATAIER